MDGAHVEYGKGLNRIIKPISDVKIVPLAFSTVIMGNRYLSQDVRRSPEVVTSPSEPLREDGYDTDGPRTAYAAAFGGFG